MILDGRRTESETEMGRPASLFQEDDRADYDNFGSWEVVLKRRVLLCCRLTFILG